MKSADDIPPYEPPILAAMFRILGALSILAALFVILFAAVHANGSVTSLDVAGACALGFGGLFQLGVGEVIDLIGRIAYHTRATHLHLQASATVSQALLSSIEVEARETALQSKRAADVLDGADVRRGP